jgi:hypothetical protein
MPYEVLAGSYHLFKRLLCFPKVAKKRSFWTVSTVTDVRNRKKYLVRSTWNSKDIACGPRLEKKIQQTLSSPNEHVKARLASESSSATQNCVMYTEQRIQKRDVSVELSTILWVGFFSGSEPVRLRWQSVEFCIRGAKFEISNWIVQKRTLT